VNYGTKNQRRVPWPKFKLTAQERDQLVRRLLTPGVEHKLIARYLDVSESWVRRLEDGDTAQLGRLLGERRELNRRVAATPAERTEANYSRRDLLDRRIRDISGLDDHPEAIARRLGIKETPAASSGAQTAEGTVTFREGTAWRMDRALAALKRDPTRARWVEGRYVAAPSESASESASHKVGGFPVPGGQERDFRLQLPVNKGRVSEKSMLPDSLEAGRRHGRLTVVRVDRDGPPSKWTVHCRCECSNSTTVRADVLLSGRAKSCGCLRRVRAAELRKSA
jgi:hypothetical protein